MTLIVTALSDSAIVQVSDRRLTCDGVVYDDNANKAIVATCVDARFVIAYTGMGLIRGRYGERTDEWITNYLSSQPLHRLRPHEVLDRLRAALTDTISQIRDIPTSQVALTVVAAGFHAGRPFLVEVTNFEDENGARLPQVAGVFLRHVFLPSEPFTRLDVVVHGTEQAVHDGLNAAINKLRTRLFQQSPRRIARGLVQTLRIASKHPQYGKYIGRDCMANLVLPSGKIISEYISEKKGKIVYAPHSVGPVVDSRSVSIVRDDRSTITVRGFFKLKRPTPPGEDGAD